MTYAYASPEQFLNQKLTTVSDIYSLGVMFYDLISGCRPYETKGLTPGKMEEQICSLMPKEPSRMIQALASEKGEANQAKLATLCKNRQKNSPRALSQALKDDLDYIAQRALAKEPDRRFDSVGDMAQCISDVLEHRPLRMRKTEHWYHFKKYVRRNWKLLSTAASIFLILSVSTWNYRAQKKQIESEKNQVEETQRLILSIFNGADPVLNKGKDITVRQILDAGREMVEKNTQLRPETLADLKTFLGRVYLYLGHYSDSEELLKSSLESYKNLYGEGHEKTLNGELILALSYFGDGNFNQSEIHLNNLESQDENIHKAQENHFERIMSTKFLLSMTHSYHGNIKEANKYLDELSEHISTNKEKHKTYDSLVTTARLVMSNLFMDFDQSMMLIEKALASAQEIYGNDHMVTGCLLTSRGTQKSLLGRYDEAIEDLNSGSDIIGRHLGSDHITYGVALRELASALFFKGEVTMTQEKTTKKQVCSPEGLVYTTV